MLVVAPMAKAQTNRTVAAQWLATAEVAPAFQVPGTRAAWEKKRAQVRGQLWQLLGRLPPRPDQPSVKVLSREDRGDYAVEKFEFDNQAGAIVPGYLFLPKHAPHKSPGILYCHWHGGQYDIGKAELFKTNRQEIPYPPGPTLARKGYAVLGIDAY